MPPAQSSTPRVAPSEPDESQRSDELDAAGRVEYLTEVMAEIDAEVRRRRASGDLPAGLERDLDELFLEFSPVGLHGKARLRETLALVDGSAYVDIAVPVESQKAVGGYIKRFIRKSLNWYIGFIVHQIVKFAWAVSRMFHVVVAHVEDLEDEVAAQRVPELPPSAVPAGDPGSGWWSLEAVTTMAGVRGRVLHADCGNGSLIDALIAAGVDAYGVDSSDPVIESAVERGLDVRAESVLDHLDVVADEALSGIVLSGSVQWLHPNERDRLVKLAASRLAIDGVLVLHSASPESWMAATSHVISDLAPGRPLHADTWSHLLVEQGFGRVSVTLGGQDRRIEPVPTANPGAESLNATIEAVNTLLLGKGEYLLTAVRER